jgi:hypothetical protein
MAATVATHSAGGASAYVVSWTAPAWDPAGMSVLVDPSSGAVFAFVDQRFGVPIAAPTIGAAAATTLAKGSIATPGSSCSLRTSGSPRTDRTGTSR